MAMTDFKLIEKIKLTHDVYELVFEPSEQKSMLSGQFITFILDKIGGRAYSILELDNQKLKFIIKKWPLDGGGRGGSKYICELKLGDILKGVGPSGHFILQKNNKNKLFIGTGTGFVPLWNQILGSIESKQDCYIKLLFGARTQTDLFYQKKLENIKKKNPNFDFEYYLSRENQDGYNHGYTTDFLNKENVSNFEEYYICGAPSMIESAIKKLKELGVSEENIYFEKY